MKKVYFVIALQFLMITLEAQSSFNWAKKGGLWAYDYGYAVDTDNNGNLYVAGKYEENGAEFNTQTVTCQGNHDMFLASYNQSNGNLNWIRTAGGSLGDYAQAMVCDGTNLYVAGELEGVNQTVTFQGSSTTLQTVGDNDLFVAKYDLTGNLVQ